MGIYSGCFRPSKGRNEKSLDAPSLTVRVEANGSCESLPGAYHTCTYRIVQEAPHNIVKHTSAKAAGVTFRSTKDALDLTIADDGKGFCSALENGMSLLGIEERVGRLAGKLDVPSFPNKGTSIRNFQVVGEAGDGRELLRLVEELTLDVAIAVIGMSTLNGTEATSQIVGQDIP